jgi:hypothetical protein
MIELAIRTAAQLTGGKAAKMIGWADKGTCVHDLLAQAGHPDVTLQWAQDSGAAAFGCVASLFKENSKPGILVGAITLAASLIVSVVSAAWSGIDTALGNAHHVLTVTPPNTATPQPATSCPSAAIIEQALAAQASWWRPGYTVPATDITCAGPYVLAGFQESPLIGARSLLEQQTSGLKLLTTGSGPICTTSPANAVPGQVTYVPPQYGHALNCVP